MVENKIIKCYDKIEIFPQNKVDYIMIVRPDGKTEKLYSFIYQPIKLAYNQQGGESVVLSGDSKDCFRYYPQMTGEFIFVAYFNDIAIQRDKVMVDRSDHCGYITVSQKDTRYFAYTNGDVFFPIGINLAFPTCYGKSNQKEFGLTGKFEYTGLRQYERWFKKCSQNGVNMVRIWLGHEYFCPDTPECGFRYQQFTKIDCLLDLAEKYQIKLKLTLEQFRFFDYERSAVSNSYSDDVFRKFNKKMILNNERCESSDQWLVGRQWQEQWLGKVQEYAKRYAGNRSIFAIELWNEMNSIGSLDNMVQWNRIMLVKVKEMFPHHMVTNSLGSFDSKFAEKSYKGFCWDLCSFKQMHRYLDLGAQHNACKHSPIEMLEDGVTAMEVLTTSSDADTNRHIGKPADKHTKCKGVPLLVGETGAVESCHSGPFRYYVNDDRGILFVDSVYTPIFLGCAGCGNIWHWDDRYVEFKNLYKYFKPLKKLIEDVLFDRENFQPINLSDNKAHIYILKGKSVALGFIRNKNDNWTNTLRDSKQPETIENVEICINGCVAVEKYSIWEQDITEVFLQKQKIIFKNINFGCCFKAILDQYPFG